MTGAEVKAKREEKGITQSKLSELSGVPLGTIGRIEASKDEPIKKASVVAALQNVLFDNTEEFNNLGPLTKTNNLIPMYNFPSAASDIEIYNNPEEVKVIGYLNLPGTRKNSFALQVFGHSMYPTLENGSWCVLRELHDVHEIVWGEVYYIEWGDYRMFKRLLQADNPDEVMLWSDNQLDLIGERPKYAPVIIKKEKIRRLCLLTDIVKKPNY